MRSVPAIMLLSLLSTICHAAAPADPQQLRADSAAVPALPHQGKVISTIEASVYTYIEVSEANKTVWLAAPTIKLQKGDSIRFADGLLMANFYSNTLDRSFPEIYFVNKVVAAK